MAPATSDISPLRSMVFLGIVVTPILILCVPIFDLYCFPVPLFLGIAVSLLLTTANLVSIIGSIFLVMTDNTRDRRALNAHFLISMTLSFVLCLSKAVERGGFGKFTEGDIVLCTLLVMWMHTCSMLSAIWIRGGTGALVCEAKAVPGNLWHFLYE